MNIELFTEFLYRNKVKYLKSLPLNTSLQKFDTFTDNGSMQYFYFILLLIIRILFVNTYIHVRVTLQRNCLFWLKFYNTHTHTHTRARARARVRACVCVCVCVCECTSPIQLVQKQYLIYKHNRVSGF